MSEQDEYERYVREGQAAKDCLEGYAEAQDASEATDVLLEAQVHATLALAAATAWGVTRRTTPWAEPAVVAQKVEQLANQGRIQTADLAKVCNRVRNHPDDCDWVLKPTGGIGVCMVRDCERPTREPLWWCEQHRCTKPYQGQTRAESGTVGS